MTAIPAFESPPPSGLVGNWRRHTWAWDWQPGDRFEPVRIKGKARITVRVGDVPGVSLPPGAEVDLETSVDGKTWSRRRVRLNHQGAATELRGEFGLVRPVVSGKTAGRVAITLTVDPNKAPRRLTGEAA